ncbi:dihydrolipoyl dehydrogenase [Nocardioides humi]|uniref:Dihydrolipoyl dehydrogenase n=1 Tax=Nocardioides humi TaxID=449461 RepID=A0ABN2AGR9_9ACTN|nr:dihydrolipoyl dehydrogenase [Nocardioides humi]
MSSKMVSSDVLVVGAGPGGYVAAIRAAQLGLSVTVVEERYWGGVCLNIGCIPTKTLLDSADLVRRAKAEAAMLGVTSSNVIPDYELAFERSRHVAAGRARGVRYLMKKNGIIQIDGRARFVDLNEVEVALSDGTTQRVRFGSAVIATGARPRPLEGVPFGNGIVSYAEQILSSSAPRSVGIVGGGAIGTEFAVLLKTFGADVTVLESESRLLPREDLDVSREVERAFRRSKIEVVTDASLQSVESAGDHVRVSVAAGGELRNISVETLLVSVGFLPNVENLGLEALGITFAPEAGIETDEYMRTDVANIYAIGDVTMRMPLAHVAEAQGIIAAESIAGRSPTPIAYEMVPRVTFTEPQVASFGPTELEARQSGMDVVTASFPFAANGKAHAANSTAGFVKLVKDSATGHIVGAHLVGPHVSELLPELTLAGHACLSAEQVLVNMHSHPSLGEAVQEALHGLVDRPINI